MGVWPGELPKLKNPLEEVEDNRRRLLAEHKAAREKALKAAEEARAKEQELARNRRTIVLGQLQTGDLTKTQHHELDARLRAVMDWTKPETVRVMAGIVADQSVPIEQREKLLEVMILRSRADVPQSGDFTDAVAGVGRSAGVLNVNGFYFSGVENALLKGDPALFAELSKSGDNLPPPSNRAPATEFVYDLLRENGSKGDFQGRQQFETWVKGLPPETQGRVMFHLSDAAGTKDYDEKSHVTGGEISVMEVGLGIQWDRAPDSHWAQVGSDVSRAVVHDLKGEEARTAFSKGFQAAKMSVPE